MEAAADGGSGGGEDCCVRVVVHIWPLIGDERIQGCKDCVSVTSGKPQVQIGTHSFTFDHVYGSTGSAPSAIFDESAVPLVDGLFQGYNATVLAYGQTGLGKTYTMGTGFKDGVQVGIIPQVMCALFNKIETLKHQTEFQLHVSFIEILKEEVRDLLNTASLNKMNTGNGLPGKVTIPGKPPIKIRESSTGVITLAGSTEVSVSTLKEMAAYLEQGSLNRATGSTNMNNQSRLYFTRVLLGSPPREFFVQIDTGSDVLWVSCSSCNGCPRTSGLQLEFFDPGSSSTASLIACSDQRCSLGTESSDSGCSANSNQCSYSFQYGDGSGTSGYYVSDLMHLEIIVEESVTTNYSSPVVFGCSTSQTGDLMKNGRAVDGIFGFGQHDMSVISQLASQGVTSRAFSHCLKGSDSGGGILMLGEIVEPSIVYSPLVPLQPHYNLNLQSISINGQALNIDPTVLRTEIDNMKQSQEEREKSLLEKMEQKMEEREKQMEEKMNKMLAVVERLQRDNPHVDDN